MVILYLFGGPISVLYASDLNMITYNKIKSKEEQTIKAHPESDFQFYIKEDNISCKINKWE